MDAAKDTTSTGEQKKFISDGKQVATLFVPSVLLIVYLAMVVTHALVAKIWSQMCLMALTGAMFVALLTLSIWRLSGAGTKKSKFLDLLPLLVGSVLGGGVMSLAITHIPQLHLEIPFFQAHSTWNFIYLGVLVLTSTVILGSIVRFLVLGSTNASPKVVPTGEAESVSSDAINGCEAMEPKHEEQKSNGVDDNNQYGRGMFQDV